MERFVTIIFDRPLGVPAMPISLSNKQDTPGTDVPGVSCL